jgi:hypothetical protein
MRRFLLTAAVLGAIGACTSDVGDRTALREGVATNQRDRISAFVAAQRAADSRVCVEEGLLVGTVAHDECMRARAGARRDALHGPAGDAIERAATGKCWNSQFRVRLSCLDI